ncbi:ATP-binding protein [Loktanella sp. SALINAS62]|uniref:sensor histidine kinase n=1 Tax=Loktanella sp. SALINAS62 TaxID=2706124 RepID=UPI0020133332|nr:ATP-binding protein [Loktanella sp. SALINAS62]
MSLQITGSLLFVFVAGFLNLIIVGNNAIRMADEAAFSREERAATRSLSSVIASIPEQQRSATFWDDAIENIQNFDEEWMDENLGSWMQEYFGHHENYVLNEVGDPIFVSVLGDIRSVDTYSTRASAVAPLVAELQKIVADISLGQSNPNEALTEAEIVKPLRIDDKVAIVSIVPVISDSGEIIQVPGTENLHVAMRFLDDALASSIGAATELADVSFTTSEPSGVQAGVPVSGPRGQVLSWLSWTPERPGTDLFLKMLPVLLVVGALGLALFFWIVRRLVQLSRKLQASEAQALMDVETLVQARKAADAGNRAKVNFMSIVSHELRTPLTVILGYARLGKNLQKMPAAKRLESLLLEQEINRELVQSQIEELLRSANTGMAKVEKSGEHLLFLVNELLDYAKMETGRLEVAPEICNVQDVLQPVMEQMKVLTDQKGLTLETEIPSCLMLADINRTRQIIINLMGNAIKFTDAGKVSVSVSQSQDKVHIAVGDTGPGIAPSELENIFEAFHQVDISSSRTAPGTGLGLSIAKELARLESGEIHVRSKTGAGSVFTLSLPKGTSSKLEIAA